MPSSRSIRFLWLGLVSSLFTGAAAAAPIEIDDHFATGEHGWSAFFVDHPPGVEEDWDMAAGLRPLPEELGTTDTGFMITGDNHSDDLGMALKKRLGPEDGIVAGQTYWVEFAITFASNAPDGAIGVGGSPGSGVYLKAGASAIEPEPVLEAATQHLRPNVNVGFQSLGGPAATVSGNIENGRDANLPAQFVTLTRQHRHRYPVRAGDDGSLWLLVLTDSAFEGPTTLYYQRIQATLTPVALGDGSGVVNLSTRARVGTGEQRLLAGFVLAGEGASPYLIRGIGPGLEPFDVPDVLPDPRLVLLRGGTEPIASNDDWSTSPDRAALLADTAKAGAFPLADPSADAALRAELPPGLYTALVEGATEQPGTGLVELYAVPEAGRTTRFVNLSTRGPAGSGATALIAGLQIAGTQPERLLIRAVGPGLAEFNIADPVTDPVLTLYAGQQPIATNHDWEVVNASAEVAAAAAAAGAFPLQPGSKDAALVITLEPGTYTIMVEDGQPDAARTALVEVYRLP